MADDHPANFEEIARRFSHLWQALNGHAGKAHSPDIRKILIDKVRDALDRGEARLSDAEPAIIANSFVLEVLVYDGAATQVYRARHRDLGTLHAIKMPRPDHADDPVLRKLILREADIGMALRHPHIAATQTVLRLDDGRPALVMEWIESRLADHLQERPLSPREIIDVMTSMLSGLDAIHAAGLVHCDLSPLNLLFDGDLAHLKIADFGIALKAGCRHEEFDLAFAGQPDFVSPEQATGEPVDGRCDLYAAGRLLSLLLSHCSTECDGKLKALAIRLSQRDRQDRPENAKAALHLLGGPAERPVDF
ncbi:serine/threonine protein kinase-like domain-containing protein (plasmid) [Rhizobium etli bv. mimosae str. IE4771]|uniref:Serine/threonine protein kinase-like domain-containing protein n=1 Tax=Rhizobium etli bv. mimosae str. IE4771 TaxID=1432050 RepID=A0A060IB82_RHIET|nr:serine/threonine-protein kinase [Rhizobium sp. IE4771]AIC31012.1 serine/threonine protein kinase-like domain-containing protein [Rhizobium sp. IE4771]